VAAFVEGRPGWVFAFGPQYNRQLLANPDLFYSRPFMDAPPGSALERLPDQTVKGKAGPIEAHHLMNLPAPPPG
jgi:hypothetical protein